MRIQPRRALTAITSLVTSARLKTKISIMLIVVVAAVAAGMAGTTEASRLGSLLLHNVSPSTTTGAEEPKSATPKASSVLTALTQSAGLNSARRGHTATRLNDGRVLIAGGEDSAGQLSGTEIFDPASGTFSVSGNMSATRADHSAVKLGDGRVLITGGRNGSGTVDTTEIFDPSTGTFSSGPAMGVARAGHSATLLADGRAFVAGGDSSGSAETFDPSSGTFSAITAHMNSARSKHSAALLPDGRVLLVGGQSGDGLAGFSAEIFDPAGSSFATIAATLRVARELPHLHVLFDGKVQIIGGNDDGSMEIYDSVNEIMGAYAHVLPETDPCVNFPNYVLSSQTRAALFHNGQSEALKDRSGHTITELAGNRALVAGGTNSSGSVLGTASTLNSSPTSITTNKLDYAPGETVQLSGRGWQPGETVRIMIHEDPHTPQERGLEAQADGDGHISGTYLVQDYDLNMKFIVGARGLSSGWTAQTTFTDARLNTLAVGAQSPNPVTAGSSATYPVTVGFNGNAIACQVDLTISGLPSGATGSFSPNPVTGSGVVNISSTLTVNTAGATPAGTTTFTVTAATRAGCTNHPASLTANGTLAVQANTVSITFDATPISDVAPATTVLSVTIGGGPATSVTQGDLPKTFSGIAPGTSVSYSYNSPLAVSGTKQYRWNSTSGLGQTLQSNTFTLNGNGTVTGNYVAQFLQTFTHAGLTGDATGTVVTVDGDNKSFGDLAFSKFVDAGATVSYAFNDPVSSSVTGKRYRLDSVTGPLTGYTVSGANTVTGNYVAQFLQTFTHVGLTGDATGTVVTVDGDAKTFGDLPFSKFVDAGTTVSYTFNDPVTSSVSGKQYRLDSVTGPTTGYTVSAANTVTGNYVAQYKLTLAITAGVPGGLANITGGTDGTFYDDGTMLTLTGDTPVADGPGKRWRFDNWTGDVSSPPNTSNPVMVTMDQARSITANYVVQWQLTFAQSGIGTDTGGNTVVTIGATPMSKTDLPFSDWFDDGSTVTYTYSTPVNTDPASTKRYRLTSVTGITSGSTVTAASTITGNYIVQWQITFAQVGIGSDTGTNTVVTIGASSKTKSDLPLSDWFDNGSTVTYTYSTPVNTDPASTKRYRLTSVTGIASGATVTAASTITGSYVTQWQLTFTATGIPIGGASQTGANTVVTVNGSPKTAAVLPFSDWFDDGASVSYVYSTPISTDPVSATQYELTNAGSLPSSPITVTSGMTITGDYSVNVYTIHYLSPLDESTSALFRVNTGKNGRVIPVKVQIFKNGIPVETGTVIMKVAGSNCAAGTGDAPVEEYADAGSSNANTNLFRFTVGSPAFWIYNLDTRALGLVTNNCYRLDVYLGSTTGPTAIKLSTSVWAIFKPTK